jgi:hypothetical protein
LFLALLFSKKKGADEFDHSVALKGGSVKEGGSVEDKKKKVFTVPISIRIGDSFCFLILETLGDGWRI